MAKRARPKFRPAHYTVPLDRNNLGQRANEKMAIEVPRLDDLMQHYGIRPDEKNPVLPWMLLSLSLARDFVPNFAPKDRSPKAGRKLSPDSYLIVLEVGALANQREISIAAACKLLSEQDRAPWKGRDVRSIEADYYARKARLLRSPHGKRMYEIWQVMSNHPAAGNVHHEVASLMAMKNLYG
jgi:hypothetical protein